ncbi:DUF3093 domain-containing protein [Gordonia soli]|uniref:DUF3093 domain-containing protein n=1 Tax=Gordonia soli NBRC 108243 TaxID=1223545 RepID=M0QJW5_9ACTN|nr:DUF3093 domain-containing protein [Gordonia soli]GAC68895.1 hypothetical protein GS4_19_00850 [Gordonia soli NBRC 108243]
MTEPDSPDRPDDTSSSHRTTGPGAADRFTERLGLPWWWWPAGAVVTGVVGYEIQLSAHRAVWSVVGYVVVAALITLLFWSMSRVRIRVGADGELHADKAVLPRAVIARGATIPATAKSAALGRQLDPAAYLVHRAWIKTMVLLVLDDPDDPTPYWLVSTRRPAELLAALDIPDAAAGGVDAD